jgi:lysophospholipase L1-like esterase
MPQFMSNTKTLKYLALGDSYTIGESVAEHERWPVILSQLLTNNNIKIATPTIIAQTGWTTAELIEAIENQNIKEKFDMVSVLIGVNNQYRGQAVDRYEVELQKLLEMAVNFTDNNPTKVFMLSIPDWGVSPFAADRDGLKITKEIDEFNNIAAQICQKLNIRFIDITPLSRLAQNDISLIANDLLHFSGKMYQQWALATHKFIHSGGGG